MGMLKNVNGALGVKMMKLQRTTKTTLFLTNSYYLVVLCNFIILTPSAPFTFF